MTPNTITISNPSPTAFVRSAEAHELTDRERKEQIVRSVSRETGLDVQTGFNIVNSETGGTWDCTKIGTSGEEGCLQIIRKFHPGVEPLNFEDAFRYFAEQYLAGNGHKWVPCSCWAHIKANKIHDLPPTKDIYPNSRPVEGSVGILKYGEVMHYVYVKKLDTDGFWASEANKEPCKIDDNVFYEWGDTNLVGFFDPALQTDKN